MLHKKTAYSFMVALLFLSIEVMSSSNDQGRLLGELATKWNDLEFQQSFKGRAKNASKPLAKDFGVFCCLSLTACAASHFLCPGTGGHWDMAPLIQMMPQCLNVGLGLGCAANTLKQECCDKPAQARIAQEDLKNAILKSYSYEQIKETCGDKHPLFLVMKNVSKKME